MTDTTSHRDNAGNQDCSIVQKQHKLCTQENQAFQETISIQNDRIVIKNSANSSSNSNLAIDVVPRE